MSSPVRTLPRRRVVVTGVSLISGCGLTAEENWSNLVAGRSGIGPITKFDATAFDTKFAGEVRGFSAADWMDRKDVKKADTFVHYAIATARMALADSGLVIGPENAERVGVDIGSGIGGLPLIEETHTKLLERGPSRISPFFIPGLIVNISAGWVAILTGAKGPNTASCTACASSSHAIGDAFKIIERGDADAMICGGTEAVVSPLCVGGFNAMKALSTRNDEPQRASRPWDAGRDGFVLGEGSGMLVLEEMESAVRRGARIYGEMAGYGMTGDAYHISAPSEDGDGPARVMAKAIADAGLTPDQVDYVNAHGTSTPHGDRVETLAIKRVFGDHAKKLMISSSKSMTGHLLGAAGGLEAAITTLALYHGKVPPTINYEVPDPECDLDYVPNVARDAKIRVAMSNSFGFGGTNACLVLKAWEPGS